MTRHLTPEQMIDVAEGARPEIDIPHLASCEQCRRQVADLRDAMSASASADVPEPSPLFWDHFSARVTEAVASSKQKPWWIVSLAPATWSRAAVALVAAAVVIAAAVMVRSSHRAPAQSAVAQRHAEPTLADDPLLDLVADLGVDVDWESAAEVGLTTREGTADRAVTQLNEEERAELQRLLEQELKRAGD
jgi:hypothetical protein